MGTVYEAIDRRDNTRAAIKILKPELAAAPAYKERFRREAHLAALLRSPYTVKVLDYGVDRGQYFIAMEYIEGRTVKDLVETGPLPPTRALQIAAQVARALEESSVRSVTHRDIKPDNILIDGEGVAKVTDFGIARQLGDYLTVTGGFLGTLLYAAPEQIEGKADVRTDIYALGGTLYFMLSGQPPFPRGVIDAAAGTPLALEPLHDLPSSVINLIQRCLHRDPDQRLQTASELIQALDDPSRVQPIEVAAAPPVSLALGRAKVGPLGGRLGSAVYPVIFRSQVDEPVQLNLACSDEENDCRFALPDTVALNPNAERVIELKAWPKKRRWRGRRKMVPFVVSASPTDGGAPAMVAGEFDDRPYGGLPYGVGLASAAGGAAVLGVFFAAGFFAGGGEVETPAVAPTPPQVFVIREFTRRELNSPCQMPPVAANGEADAAGGEVEGGGAVAGAGNCGRMTFFIGPLTFSGDSLLIDYDIVFECGQGEESATVSWISDEELESVYVEDGSSGERFLANEVTGLLGTTGDAIIGCGDRDSGYWQFPVGDAREGLRFVHPDLAEEGTGDTPPIDIPSP
jgi:Protein kinase domain